MKTILKTSLVTLSVLVSLAAHAEENNSNKDQNKPAATAPADATAPNAAVAEAPVPCPLPGEPAANCPAPNRAPEDTEGGVPYVATAGTRPEINTKVILTTPGKNAHSGAIPLSPLKDDNKKSGTSK
jgi:hypothetical protein